MTFKIAVILFIIRIKNRLININRKGIFEKYIPNMSVL